MPPVMRLIVLMFFGLVFLSAFLPMCFSLPFIVGSGAMVASESAPTADDRRIAKELNAAARDAGRDLDVSAVEIAHARRNGQMDELEEAADVMLEGRWRPRSEAPAPAPRRRDPTAYYPGAEAEETSVGIPWLGITVVLVGMLSTVAALGAALFAATGGTSAVPESDAPSPFPQSPPPFPGDQPEDR